MTESKWDKKLRAIWDEMMKDPTVPAHDIMFDFARRAYDPRRTHPEAQGNKDLGEPPLTRLEVRQVNDPFTGEKVLVRNDLTRRLRGEYAVGPTLPSGEPEFGWRKFGEPTGLHLEAAAEIERLRLLLQAALAAAPTSPQPIKGDKTEALTDAATLQGLEGL